MNSIVCILALVAALAASDGMTAGTDAARRYPNYYAARQALERGDCDTAVGHLQAYLHDHPDIREKHPAHFREVKFVIAQCKGSVRIRGVGDEASEIDPLPEHPPMAR